MKKVKYIHTFIIILMAILLQSCSSPMPDSKYFLTSYSEKKLAVQTDDGWGYMDQSGKWIIQPQFSQVSPFKENRASVRIKHQRDFADKRYGPVGVIDENGKIVIEAKYNRVGAFSEGLAAFTIKTRKSGLIMGLIDLNGKEILPARYPWIKPFSEGFAAFKYKNKWGYLNRNGRVVIRPKYDSVGAFHEGIAPVQVRSRWGMINKDGDFTIAPKLSNPPRFSKGIGILKLHNRFGYINRRGKLQIQAIYAKASPFSEGKAAAQYFNGKWVYLNEDGRVQFKNARFDYAIPFSDGLAGVNNGAEWELGVGGSLMFKGGGNWGYIDKQGEKVIPLRYQWVTPFRNERAKVAYKGKVWVIDTKGKLLFQIPKLTPPIITEQQTPLPMLPPSKP